MTFFFFLLSLHAQLLFLSLYRCLKYFFYRLRLFGWALSKNYPIVIIIIEIRMLFITSSLLNDSPSFLHCCLFFVTIPLSNLLSATTNLVFWECFFSFFCYWLNFLISWSFSSFLSVTGKSHTFVLFERWKWTIIAGKIGNRV